MNALVDRQVVEDIAFDLRIALVLVEEELVDEILENERRLQEELNLATKNVFRYKRVRTVILKLSAAWFAAAMVYYGIMLTPIPDGVLLNNFILGTLSAIAGPAMMVVMKTRFANRRTLMAEFAKKSIFL